MTVYHQIENSLEMTMLHQIENSLEMTVSHQIEKSLEMTAPPNWGKFKMTVFHQIEKNNPFWAFWMKILKLDRPGSQVFQHLDK